MCLQGEPGASPVTAKAPAKFIARLLHSSIRGHVRSYTEWDQLDDGTRNVFMAQAGALLESYVMLPFDNTAGCSGCRTCTEALDRLDCARRDFIGMLEEARALRLALANLVGASRKEELEKMELIMRAMPAPAEDKAAAIDAIHALLKAVHSVPVTPVDVDRTHEECEYCALATINPAVCAGHPAGPTACPDFKGAEVC